MKARELIEILQTLDPETLILVDGYESDYDTVSASREIEVYGPHDTDWWDGSYKQCSKDELLRIKGFVLHRKSA